MVLKKGSNLKPGASSMFVGRENRGSAIGWRLDVREDGGGDTPRFGRRKKSGAMRTRNKLFHYIAAGGMRQLRRTTADDIAEQRRQAFTIFLGVVAVVWVFFYFLPTV